MKAYTDLEQSHKLTEILPHESADMIWANDNDVIVVPYDIVTRENVLHDFIPCWSLAALLDILPNGTNIIKEEADTENEQYMCTVGAKNNIISTFGKNPVDACYEMILKLHKLNLL